MASSLLNLLNSSKNTSATGSSGSTGIRPHSAASSSATPAACARRASLSHDMSSWMMRSTEAAALVMLSRMPSDSVKPRTFWSRARSSNCVADFLELGFQGSELCRVGASIAASMVAKGADRAS